MPMIKANEANIVRRPLEIAKINRMKLVSYTQNMKCRIHHKYSYISVNDHIGIQT